MRTARIANARIVTPTGMVEGDILYEMPGPREPALGKILEIGCCCEGADETIDADGAWAVPGGIDPHVHFGGFGDTPIADDFYQGSRAALAGGTTTVIDFVEPDGAETVEHVLERRRADAATSAVDYAFHFVLTEDYERLLADLPLIEAAGIHDFKLFTIYPGETLGLEDIDRILGRLAPDGRTTFLVHAEDPVQIGRLIEETGDTRSFHDLAATRPPESEVRMTRELKCLTEAHAARLCVAHSTCAGTAELLDEPVSAGKFRLETCPHYLEFTDMALTGPEGWRYTMTPPLRTPEHRLALWSRILDGKLDILSTDHCPYATRYKRGATYQTVPCGIDGVGTRMAWAYSRCVHERGMGMIPFVRLTSEAAARFYGLFPAKGALAPGSDADIALISDDAWIARVQDAVDALDYTAWEGCRFSGRVKLTVKGGATAFDGERVLAAPGTGRQLDKTKMGA